MTAADLLVRDDLGVLDEMSDRLAVAFLRLHRAAAVDQFLVESESNYQGGAVAVAVHEAIAAIDAAVEAHDLADGQVFWAQPAYAAGVATANTLASLPVTEDAAELMIDHLGGSLDSLLGAKLHTEDNNVDAAISAVCRALTAAVEL